MGPRVQPKIDAIIVRYIADLHIHSLYSRATSRASHLHGLATWAAIKGIQVVGTGDFTHPAWFNQLVENLEEAEPGFFRLKADLIDKAEVAIPDGVLPDIKNIRFVLTSEISSIYKRGGRVRKVHNILFAPDFASVRRISSTLAGIGNLESDGRPILGLDSRNLLEILLEKAPKGFLVPAHIWTPWFSLFGSKSGFDTIEECFDDLSSHIFALETGLSSDPDMNRLLSALDRFTLISNSDCHSPAKIGREANIFSTDFNFYAMREAIRSPIDASGNQVFESTIEFYPEEGKYHFDGHRKCGVCLSPAETQDVGGRCPECGRPLTIGVLNRVMELADRSEPQYPHGSPAVHSLVPLPELLGELLGTGPTTKRVMRAYAKLLRHFGSEFHILLQAEIDELNREASPLLGEAIHRIRTGQVIKQPGYDGEFGVIRVFTSQERRCFGGQLNLFGISSAKPGKKKMPRKTADRLTRSHTKKLPPTDKKTLNPEQLQAVVSRAERIIVKAGPGTGKTHTLVQRVIRLATENKTPCTVITFTNKAADEVQQRLSAALGLKAPVQVATFHGYCLQWLRKENPDLRVAGPRIRRWILRAVYPGLTAAEIQNLDQDITAFLIHSSEPSLSIPSRLQSYFSTLEKENLLDIDAVIPRVTAMLRQENTLGAVMRRATGALFIDEFQDLNRNQYELVRLLSETSSVFAIGDPDQSIYAFRGSSPTWFFRFIEKLHSEQHVLVRNYRSASVIVEAAQNVIAVNPHPIFTERSLAMTDQSGEIFVHKAATPRAEAFFIVHQVERLLGGTSHREIEKLSGEDGAHVTLSDIAVLYRTGRQAEVLARVFADHGIPIQLVDLIPFYCLKPVMTLYLWVLLAAQRAESAHLFSLLQLEKGIGKKSLRILEKDLPAGCRDPLIMLSTLEQDYPVKLGTAIAEFRSFCGLLVKEATDNGIKTALNLVVSRYGLNPAETNIVRFMRMAATFGRSLESFADHLQKYENTVVYDERAESVTLMTLHASKGLEFPVVFVAGLEEGIVPLAMPQDASAETEQQRLEEERRLFYVGITRAERILFLTHVTERKMRGRIRRQQPSRFLREIPANLLRHLKSKKVKRNIANYKARQLALFKG